MLKAKSHTQIPLDPLMPISDDPLAIGLLIGITVLWYLHVWLKIQENKKHGGKWYRDGGGFHSNE